VLIPISHNRRDKGRSYVGEHIREPECPFDTSKVRIWRKSSSRQVAPLTTDYWHLPFLPNGAVLHAPSLEVSTSPQQITPYFKPDPRLTNGMHQVPGFRSMSRSKNYTSEDEKGDCLVGYGRRIGWGLRQMDTDFSCSPCHQLSPRMSVFPLLV
jgi:hypothetical protein